MAKRLFEPTPEQKAGWNEWVASRPESVRRVAERFNPWTLYRITPNGPRVTLVSFGEGEDGTVTLTVNVSGKFNLVMFERHVFGIKPDDLEPCDPPNDATEVTGSLMSPQDVDNNIDALRVLARPDLWELDPKTFRTKRSVTKRRDRSRGRFDTSRTC